jgi:hypothetical protein
MLKEIPLLAAKDVLKPMQKQSDKKSETETTWQKLRPSKIDPRGRIDLLQVQKCIQPT